MIALLDRIVVVRRLSVLVETMNETPWSDVAERDRLSYDIEKLDNLLDSADCLAARDLAERRYQIDMEYWEQLQRHHDQYLFTEYVADPDWDGDY